MIEINGTEYAIYELLRLGHSVEQIAEQLERNPVYVRKLLRALAYFGLLKKHKRGDYTVVEGAVFKVVEKVKGRAEPKSNRPLPEGATKKKRPEGIKVPKHIQMYLTAHYGIMSRTQLKNELKISKIQLNYYLIEMGLGS